MNSVSYTAAFVAGVLSITSPCVLPVIPLYVAYLMGSSDRTRDRRRTLIVNAAAFVLGFSLVFVLVGTAFGVLGTLMAERKTLLVQLGGLLLIALGLHQIGRRDSRGCVDQFGSRPQRLPVATPSRQAWSG